jgi:purine-binding chemotaxis protein CheW
MSNIDTQNEIDDEEALMQDVGDQVKEEYLTFLLGGEEYGVDILSVQEIRGWDTVTRIPNTAKYIKGVMNLRGAIVPILDLRERFDLENKEMTATTVVIVVRICAADVEKVTGFVVDGVSGVVETTVGDIKVAPAFGKGVNTEFIKGLVSNNDAMVMLLDIAKLLHSEGLLKSADEQMETA